MNRYLSIALSIAFLIGVTLGTIFWIRALNESIENFQSPLREVELAPQPQLISKMANVVVVLISGLGYDDSQALDMPVFAQLTQTGASAAIQSFPPTYSQTSQITLVTGAPPETNSAPPNDLPLEDLSLIEIDSIFAQAHQTQQKTAIFGLNHWQRLIPRNHLDETLFVNTPGPEADQAIMEVALPLLKGNNIDLTLIHLTQLDFAANRQGGPTSNAYRLAASRIDAYLGQISQTMDLSNGVLVILSDHGYTASGGHGGDEAEIIWQPLVMVGEGIAPGSYSDIFQTDIAPTLSMILGTPPPTATQGRILFEMLRLDEREQTLAQLILARQRIVLAEAYLTQIGGTSTTFLDSIITDLTQAQNALTQNNVEGALQLATLIQEEVDTQITIARHSQIRAKQWSRLLVALVIILVLFSFMWRRRGIYAGSIVVATIISIGLYHILFQIQGYSYSISSLITLAELPFDITRRTAVSLLAGGGLILIFLMLSNEKDWITLLGAGYGFSVLVTFVFALPLFWAFWQNGLVLDIFLPAVGPLFWQITSLHEVMIAAILGLILPWPIMFLNLVVNLTRHYLDENQSQPEPDTVPGLHL